MAFITADRLLKNKYEVIVIGAGLGGLAATCLLAKRGVEVLLIEQHCMPGGACTSFRREGRIYDCGAALIFGFGQEGYHLHRTLMNFIEEPITVIPRDKFFRLDFNGQRILVWKNLDQFLLELERLFPDEKAELVNLYDFLRKFYDKNIKNQDLLTPPSELSNTQKIRMLLSSPMRVSRLLKLLSQSAADLMGPYIKSKRLLEFYDKLMASYAYITMRETPAIMALTMFADNHAGGTYYVAGSAQNYGNALEKAIEKNGGTILYRRKVQQILFDKTRVCGIRLNDGTEIKADRVVSDTTVWNLYHELIPSEKVTKEQKEWASSFIPTYPAMVLYAAVDKTFFPPDISAVEYFVSNTSQIDMGDITLYIPTVDDHSLGPEDEHLITVFSPAPNQKWPRPFEKEYQSPEYDKQKERQADLILKEIEKRIPNLRKGIRRLYIATPSTIERYTLKTWGCVGGPKQMIGQELTKRLHAKTEWQGLYACGDSTTMGMGTPAVIASGFGAANVILRELGKKEFHYQKFKHEYVKYIESNPAPRKPKHIDGDPENAQLVARECQYCESQPCKLQCPAGVDIAGVIRRIEAGNYVAAARLIRETNPFPEICSILCPSEQLCEKACIRTKHAAEPVQIRELHKWVAQYVGKEGWSDPVAQPNGKKIGIVGCGFEGLTCSHYLKRLGYSVILLDEAANFSKTEIFRKNKDLPEETKKRELFDVFLPSVTFKPHFTIRNLEQLAELREYEAVYITRQLDGEKLKDELANRLRNVVIERTELSYPENRLAVVHAIERGRRAAMRIHALLQK
jgi:phytoene dehydrogenase-like protein